MTAEQLYFVYLMHPFISTDTRKIEVGSIFFALKGDQFDGNHFALKALEAGAAYAVIDNLTYKSDDRFLMVDDVLAALQNLARYHRKKLNMPFIGLTGSNGKTTTKELMNAVLSQQFKTRATLGNLNNHIGVPLTILSIGVDTELAIIEMGANHRHEIAFLSRITLPDYGLITNIGKAHLEGFGGEAGVKAGKGELFDYLGEAGKTVFINHDNAVLMDMAKQRNLTNVVLYGQGNDSLVNGQLKQQSPFLKIEWWETKAAHKRFSLQTRLTGAYNLENIMAAICAGIYFGLAPDQINTGISTYEPGNNRSQVIKTNNNTLVCDFYNANPSSMLAALNNLDNLHAEKKVMILGDMFELGNESDMEHEFILKKSRKIAAHKRMFIGKDFFNHRDLSHDKYFLTMKEAVDYLKKFPVDNATILLKGSRGMALEKLLAYL
ncbi:MAG: UDP-N-acetylmuramoyl-tripeptide--D-alanyl-D-alanine ligase [Sphingobacteriaceae bacterium]